MTVEDMSVVLEGATMPPAAGGVPLPDPQLDPVEAELLAILPQLPPDDEEGDET